MKKRFFCLLLWATCSTVWSQTPSATNLTTTSPTLPAINVTTTTDSNENLYTQLDQNGFVTKRLKDALRALVAQQDALSSLQDETQQATYKGPALKMIVEASQAENAKLQQQFNDLDTQPETRFIALKTTLKDPTAKLDDQIKAAQVYTWGYPHSPHSQEAQQILSDLLNKKQAQIAQEEKDKANREARHLALVAGAKTRTLSLDDWRELLLDANKDDVIQYMGNPDHGNQDNWYYDGTWVVDPETSKTTGLVLYFNGRDLIKVSPSAASDSIPQPKAGVKGTD